MSKTTIEWTDLTWNPGIYGCSKVSPACTNCYAMGMARRLRDMGKSGYMSVGGAPDVVTDDGEWTGVVRTDPPASVEESAIRALPKRKPARVFVTSMADLFHADVPVAFLDAVFAAMATRPHLTFQVLTKRTSRMAEYAENMGIRGLAWPANVWAGTTVEDQTRADGRVPFLLRVPAKVRFLSMEPLLGPVDLSQWRPRFDHCPEEREFEETPEHLRAFDIEGGCQGCPGTGIGDCVAVMTSGIGWVIAGGESGAHARPSHPDWFRALRDQCVAAGVPFHFKQWGEWAPIPPDRGGIMRTVSSEGVAAYGAGAPMNRCGRPAAGRLLDGREWNEFPNTNQQDLTP